jgi:hypothetical protein
MTSTVTNYSNNIQSAYPTAGANNDSQGFRDNFAAIKNSLSVAASEITTLQLNGVNLNKAVNDFAFSSVLTRAQLQNSGLVAVNAASSATNVANVIPVDYSLGSYQKIAVAGGGVSTFSVSNWPNTGIYANLRLEISLASLGTITFDASQSATPGTVRNDLSAVPYTTTSTVNKTTVWELWTSDAGATVFSKFVGGPY